MKVIITIVLLVFFSSNSVWAQSLTILIEEMKQNNSFLKGQQLRIHSKLLQKEYSSTPTATSVGLEISQIPFNTLNLTGKSLSNSLTITQMFPLGSMYSLREKEAGLRVTMSNLQFKERFQMLKRELGLMYYELAFMRERIALENQKIGLMYQQLELMASMLQMNMSDNSVYLKMLSEIKMLEIDRDKMLNQSDAMVPEINAMLGRKELDKAVTTEIYRLEDSVYVLEQEFKSIDLLMEKNKIDMIENEDFMSKDELYPELMLSFMLMHMPRGMIITTGDDMMMLTGKPHSEFMYSIMASITLPFLPWVSNGIGKKIESKEVELKAALEEYNAKELEYSAIIQKMKREIKTIRDQRFKINNELFPLIDYELENALQKSALREVSIEKVLEIKIRRIDMEIQMNELLKQECLISHALSTELELNYTNEITNE